MKINKTIIGIFLLTASFVINGCSNDEYGVPTIKFSGRTNISTKSQIESDANGLLLNGSLQNIQILRAADGAATDFHLVPSITTKATLGTDGVLTPEVAQKFNTVTGNNNANFISFYPIGTYSPGKVEWVITGADDILLSKPISQGFRLKPHNNTINFEYEHALSLLKLSLVATNQLGADYFGDLESATIVSVSKVYTPITSAGFGALGTTSQMTDPQDLITLNFGTLPLGTTQQIAKQGFLVFPNENYIKDAKVQLKFANQPLKEYAISGLKLKPGMVTAINLRIDEFKLTIFIGNAGSITQYNDQVILNGSAGWLEDHLNPNLNGGGDLNNGNGPVVGGGDLNWNDQGSEGDGSTSNLNDGGSIQKVKINKTAYLLSLS